MAGGRSLWDQLLAGTGDAIADIREKLVEEPWFGRPLDVPVSELAPGREKEVGPEIGQEPQIAPPEGPDLDR